MEIIHLLVLTELILGAGIITVRYTYRSHIVILKGNLKFYE